MPEIQNARNKVLIERTRLAFYWRIVMYFASVGLSAKALAGISSGDLIGNIGNLGLGLILIGLCFRSKEAAVFAYVRNEKKRMELLKQLQEEEAKKRPFVQIILRGGWLLLFVDVGVQLSALV